MNLNNNNKNGNNRIWLGYLLPLVVLSIFFLFTLNHPEQNKMMTQGDLIHLIREKKVASLVYKDDVLKGVLKNEKEPSFSVAVPENYFPDFYKEYLKGPVEGGQFDIVFEPKTRPNVLLTMVPDLIFFLLMVFLFYNFYKRTMIQQNGMTSFGKSRARMIKSDNQKKITFKDVAGLKEEKEELQEIVDFLKNPEKFSLVGARIPKGVLMVGPPGTGKTYISRAVAGEADVPFFSISGSDFVEMFVGVGASRVRDLFEEGKKNAPCIIFVDEIDAVGRRRGAGLGGGNDEREQTLNQLLVEMDGFDPNEGIIVMAATNRPDILDPALLRPGRFDRRIVIGMPDVKEREEILQVHLRNKHPDPEVDMEAIARATAGFTPADLENLINEAALLTARKNETLISMKTFEEASIKVVAGPEKKSKHVIEKERILTAYHESGHAVVTRALPGSDEVNMITIVPRGNAGGFTAYLPQDDRNFASKKWMLTELTSFMGGRAAEAVFLDDITTGASNDIERATNIARNMVMKYGMSPTLGPVAFENEGDNVFLGNDLGQIHAYSDKTAEEIDKEIHGLIHQSYERACRILKENSELVKKLAEELLDVETVRKDEFEALFQEYGKIYDIEKEVIA